MLFTVCQNSIGKYDFYSVALYAPLLGVTGGQKPGAIRVKGTKLYRGAQG